MRRRGVGRVLVVWEASLGRVRVGRGRAEVVVSAEDEESGEDRRCWRGGGGRVV